MGWESFKFVVARKDSASAGEAAHKRQNSAPAVGASGKSSLPSLLLSLGSAKPHVPSCCLRQAAATSFSCWSAARRTFPDRRALVCCYRFFCIKVASPWRPFLLCPPQCDNPNTMIDLDDKENQSPLRLGFGNSPSPKRSRTKNTATAGQDVSDALSKQSPSGPLALVA